MKQVEGIILKEEQKIREIPVLSDLREYLAALNVAKAEFERLAASDRRCRAKNKSPLTVPLS